MEFASTTHWYLTAYEVKAIIALGLLGLGLIVVVQPYLLARLHFKNNFAAEVPNGTTSQRVHSFFQIPYINWLIVHWGFSCLALLAIVGLAVWGLFTASTAAALLGSLLGYVLGNTNSHSAGSSPIAPSTQTGQQSPESSQASSVRARANRA